MEILPDREVWRSSQSYYSYLFLYECWHCQLVGAMNEVMSLDLCYFYFNETSKNKTQRNKGTLQLELEEELLYNYEKTLILWCKWEKTKMVLTEHCVTTSLTSFHSQYSQCKRKLWSVTLAAFSIFLVIRNRVEGYHPEYNLTLSLWVIALR